MNKKKLNDSEERAFLYFLTAVIETANLSETENFDKFLTLLAEMENTEFKEFVNTYNNAAKLACHLYNKEDLPGYILALTNLSDFFEKDIL